MLTLQPIETAQILLMASIVIALILISWQFNNYIDAQADVDPLGSNSATYTVIGVAYTLLGALCILTILLGWQTAVASVGTVLICFGISGTPMIFGDIRRGGRRRRDELKKLPNRTEE